MSLEVRTFSSQEFPKTCQALDAGLSEGVAPGFVAAFWRYSDPQFIRVSAFGQQRVVPSPQPMLPDTVFDLASVTKVFGTATLAAHLVDRGWIQWDDRVRNFLPEYPHSGIRLSHLLAHTSGLPAWSPLWERLIQRFSPRFSGRSDWPVSEQPSDPAAAARYSPADAEALARASIPARQAEMRRLVHAIKPDAEPGTRVLYSDISFLLLGFALEEVLRMPLDRAIRNFVWRPLGLRTARFNRVGRSLFTPPKSDERTAATEACPWRGGVLQGLVHDDNCWAMGGYGGHAGAFASAEDVVRFGVSLLGQTGGRGGFLTPETLRKVWSRVPEPAGCSRTLGWDTPSGPDPAIGRCFSVSSVGHLGFTGTSLWIDPRHRTVVALLSNRVHPSRDNVKLKLFRPRFHDALAQDLGYCDDLTTKRN